MEKVITLHQNAEWYVKYPDSYRRWTKDYIIDGEEVTPLPDTEWTKLKEKPEKFQLRKKLPSKITGYAIKEEHKDKKLGIDKNLPADFFENDQNYEFEPFYKATRSEPETIIEDLEWQSEIIHMDAKPTKMRLLVNVQFPHAIKEYPDIHYLFPCYLNPETLFVELWHRINGVVQTRDNLKMNDYLNIHSCKFYIKI